MRIDIPDGKPIKRGRRRVDYLLRAYIEEHEYPLTLAFIEAKKERLPPTHGLEQVKEYARRHAVKFVYSTNGHQFVEYDATTGQTIGPRPMAEFPTPAELRQRWFAATDRATTRTRRCVRCSHTLRLCPPIRKRSVRFCRSPPGWERPPPQLFVGNLGRKAGRDVHRDDLFWLRCKHD